MYYQAERVSTAPIPLDNYARMRQTVKWLVSNDWGARACLLMPRISMLISGAAKAVPAAPRVMALKIISHISIQVTVRLVRVYACLLVGECCAFLASGSDPGARNI